MSNTDWFNDLMGQYTGDDGKEYRCVFCQYPMEKIVVKTVTDKPRKILYCKKNTCKQFGLLTMVAKKK